MNTLRFKLLGGCEIELASGTRIEITIKKTQALLAYLALQSGKATSRDKLANLLWSDRGDKQAQGSLRQALTMVRKTLESVEPCPLIVEHGAVSLDPSAVEVDAVSFTELIARGTMADLEAAARLYQGELLDGFVVRDPVFEEWLEGARREYREIAVRALTRLLHRKVANQERSAAIDLAQRLLRLDPLQEAVHRTLMHLYAAHGQHNAALRQFDHCRGLLERELGVPPDAATVALADKIRQDRTLTEQSARLVRFNREAASAGLVPVRTGSPSRPKPPIVDADYPGRSRDSRRLPALGVGLALILGVAAVAWLRPWERSVEPASAAKIAVALPAKTSIAVLPFANYLGDKEQESFADGMTDDLITDLAKVSGLVVIARNSVFRYKGRNVKPQAVAKDLNVSHVLEGSVRRAGDTIRINALLIDARTGGHLWADTFDREYKDIFQLQDEIAGQIVKALTVTLSPAEARKIAGPPTTDFKAYEAYLKAEELRLACDLYRYEATQTYYRTALQRDPNFIAALIGQAASALDAWRFGGYSADDPTEFRDLARRLIGRALELAPTHPMALSLRIEMHLVAMQHEPALKLARRAAQRQPNDAHLIQALATTLLAMGQRDAARAATSKAISLSRNMDWMLLRNLARNFAFLHDYDKAVLLGERALKLGGDPFRLALILAPAYAEVGRMEEAKVQIETIWWRWYSANTAQIRANFAHFQDKQMVSDHMRSYEKAGMPRWNWSGGEINLEKIERLDAEELQRILQPGFEMENEFLLQSAYVDGGELCLKNANYNMGRAICAPVYRYPAFDDDGNKGYLWPSGNSGGPRFFNIVETEI